MHTNGIVGPVKWTSRWTDPFSLDMKNLLTYSVVFAMTPITVCVCLVLLFYFQKKRHERSNTPLKIKRTGKVIKIESKNALRGLKFDTEIAKT